MNPAQKALWYIESHLAEPLTLDDVAGVAGVSRFHLVRAFAAATGVSVMRDVRVRRLSKAVQALVTLEVVREITGRQRDRVFAYTRYLDLLTQGMERR